MMNLGMLCMEIGLMGQRFVIGVKTPIIRSLSQPKKWRKNFKNVLEI